MSNMSFLLCSLFYSLLIIFVYFHKKKIKTVENNLFTIILLANFVGIILDISSVYMAHSGFHNNLFFTINKLYMFYLLTWITFFSMYTIVISTDNKYLKRIKKIFTVFLIICIPLVAVLPLYSHIENNEFYTYGPCASLLYIISGIMVVIIVVCLIKNFNQIKQKKYAPILVYIILGSIATFIQMTFPSILIITAMETFVTFLMYFTIENPDLKLIRELNIARDQAEKANNAKSDFLSNMSHEIRTPLNAIVGFSQALVEEDINDSAKEEVKDIMMASQSLLEIVNGILDISKIEANKLEIVNTEYMPSKIFEELSILTKSRIGDKPITFKTNFDQSIPRVLYGDYARLKQIVLNLLTNAAKYTKEGSIEFKVDHVIKDGVCRLIISVEDTGIGIKQENIDKLFTKFERFDLEKNITIEGTGLGLAITKKLVELMNGKIVVDSIYGEGSKFTVAIDQRIVENPTIVLEEEKNDNIDFDITGKRILIVDDNKINLKVATRLLKDYNATIDEALSGFECIDKINNGESYDLILLDDMMPKMSGVETLHKLKEIEGFNIPTVALTANAISGMKEKYLSEGFDDYLSKPIDKTELANVLIKFLQDN